MKDQKKDIGWRRRTISLLVDTEIPEDKLETIFWFVERTIAHIKPDEE
ncbi:MAG: hypothetical protein PHO41_06860 [Eubacteriales bacterium]|nr:hypothetical protein [Eubacteriales bacterium]